MTNQVYVVVTHKPSLKSFSLNRGYNLIDEDFDKDTLEGCKVVQNWDGWTPSMDAIPKWARDFPKEDFHAIWIEYLR